MSIQNWLWKSKKVKWRHSYTISNKYVQKRAQMMKARNKHKNKKVKLRPLNPFEKIVMKYESNKWFSGICIMIGKVKHLAPWYKLSPLLRRKKNLRKLINSWSSQRNLEKTTATLLNRKNINEPWRHIKNWHYPSTSINRT